MSYQSQPPIPTGDRWIDWAIKLVTYLNRIRTQLQHKVTGESAASDGVLLFDPALGHVVVSKDDVFEPLAYGHNCLGQFYTTTTQLAESANTAYAITWENTAYSEDIEVDDTVTSRINFTRAGTYQIDFSAELLSGSASSKTIYIFPRINGTDIAHSGVVETVKDNGHRHTVSRSGIFEMNAGDYLEAVFSVTDTDLTLDGSAATAFSPACPSTTLSVVQLR